MKPPAVTGAILAGGAGQRLGGLDKGLQTWRGQALTGWVLERLAPQVDEVICIANRNLEAYRTLGLRVYPDLEPGHQGPLMGMLSALRAASGEWVLCVGCDMPQLPADLALRLRAAAAAAARPVAAVHDGERLQPLACLLHKDLAGPLSETLAGGQRAVWRWLASLNPATADYADQPSAFMNVNTPEALQDH